MSFSSAVIFVSLKISNFAFPIREYIINSQRLSLCSDLGQQPEFDKTISLCGKKIGCSCSSSSEFFKRMYDIFKRTHVVQKAHATYSRGRGDRRANCKRLVHLFLLVFSIRINLTPVCCQRNSRWCPQIRFPGVLRPQKALVIHLIGGSKHMPGSLVPSLPPPHQDN